MLTKCRVQSKRRGSTPTVYMGGVRAKALGTHTRLLSRANPQCPHTAHPAPARATVQAPGRHRASQEGTAPGEEVPGQPLLPAPHGARSDRVFSTRAYGRPPPGGDERMQVVQQRQERVAPPPLHGVRGLEAADQKAVEEGRKGLRVETSKSTGGTEVVERGGHRGSARVLKGPGWVLDGAPESGEASGGGRPGR